MKTLLAIACIAFTCGCSRNAGETISFPFIFATDSDGCGSIYVRKLSVRQTESIHVQVDMMKVGMGRLRALLAGTGDPLACTLSPSQEIVSCWIDVFPEKPDGFRWGHFMPPTNLLDRWTATSGTVYVMASRYPEGVERSGFLTSVQLSNVVFRSSNTMNQATLDSLAFTNVYVGWWSE